MREPDPVTAVLNQTVLADTANAVDADGALTDAVEACDAGWALPELRAAAVAFGAAAMREHAVLANRHPPELATHDRIGRRVEAVRFHPSWHALLGLAVEHGLVSRSWEGQRRGEHVARAALMYLFAQTEAGTQCPVSMSHAVIPVLRRHQGTAAPIAEQWLAKLTSRRYDPRDLPVAAKHGALFGMGMTERQGGSDVRGNITVATPVDAAGAGQLYRVRGHKWFLSAPMCDAFLVTAQTDLGSGCLLVPRRTADGEINGLRLQRLKDKLGNRSNASSEVEFHDALGTLIGDPGAGIATIIEMATYTRLDCQLATAGMQRRALTLALRHAAQRHAFGGPLLEKPLMRAVLADLAVEAEAATLLALRTAHCFDHDDDPRGAALARLLTAAGKFHVCKRGPLFAAEAMEVFGGNGYVEELELARIFREMPLLSIWEGSGNVMCLEVLRALAREPLARDALGAELDAARGRDGRYDRFVDQVLARLQRPAEGDGRQIAHAIALAMQGSLLLRYSTAAMAQAFIGSRLAPGAAPPSFGGGAAPADIDAVLARAGAA